MKQSIRKRYPVILVIIISLHISCSNKKQIRTSIDFSFENLKESTISESISNYTIIKLATTEDSEINFIKKVIIQNEKIYVLNHLENKQEILIFSMNGSYLDKISERPGEDEFTSIIDFDIHPVNGQITIIDQKQKRMVFFSKNGSFLENHPIDYRVKEIAYGINNGKVFTVLHADPLENHSGVGYEIITYDENNERSKACFPLGEHSTFIHSNRKTLMKRSGKVMFLKEGTNELYEIGTRACRKYSNLVFPNPVMPVDKWYEAFYSGKVNIADYVYDVDCFESDKILFTTFSSTEGDYIGIYEIETNSSMLYNMLFDPSCKCGIKIDIVGSYKNNFILQIPRIKVHNIMNVLDSDRRKCNNEEMLGIIENMNPGDNPILLLLEMN